MPKNIIICPRCKILYEEVKWNKKEICVDRKCGGCEYEWCKYCSGQLDLKDHINFATRYSCPYYYGIVPTRTAKTLLFCFFPIVLFLGLAFDILKFLLVYSKCIICFHYMFRRGDPCARISGFILGFIPYLLVVPFFISFGIAAATFLWPLMLLPSWALLLHYQCRKSSEDNLNELP